MVSCLLLATREVLAGLAAVGRLSLPPTLPPTSPPPPSASPSASPSAPSFASASPYVASMIRDCPAPPSSPADTTRLKLGEWTSPVHCPPQQHITGLSSKTSGATPDLLKTILNVYYVPPYQLNNLKLSLNTIIYFAFACLG
ncbi:hypothetical protein V8C86DRAFT_2434685 [Haematococcus lacustris]